MPHPELIIFFFIVAFVYASVGFGGGSSYLAIMAMYALPFQEMRLTALICNIIVVTGGTWVYIKNRQVDWKKIIPIVLVSIPAAYLGAKMRLSRDAFFILLGGSLILASVLLWLKTKSGTGTGTAKPNYLRDGFLGGIIGTLSGMVGIGGGIFLSPLLNLINWDSSKKIAATASVFILVNSISGILGQLSSLPGQVNLGRIGLLCLAVLAGGQLGSRLGAMKLNLLMIKRVTAVLVFVAGIEVLGKHLHLF